MTKEQDAISKQLPPTGSGSPYVRQVGNKSTTTEKAQPPQTAPLNIHQRILQVYKEVTSVEKNGKIDAGSGGSYKAVTHDDVSALLHLPLANFGIFPLPTQLESKVSTFETEKFYKGESQGKKMNYMFETTVEIKFFNADDPTDFVTSKATAYALDSSDKAPGKAYSYAVKTIMLKVFMLESRDNEEDRSYEQETYGQQPPARQSQPKAPPPKPPPLRPSSPGTPPAVSEAQVKRLFALAKKAEWSNDDLKRVLAEGLKIDSTSKLTKVDYDDICKALDQKEHPQTVIDYFKT